MDLSDLAGISLGANNPEGGMKEIGFYRVEDADTWSAKTTAIERGKPFYLYGNDINRGLDIYKFDWEAEESASRGQWLTPAQALARATRLGVDTSAKPELYCVVTGN